MQLAIDIDGVLADLDGAMLRAINARHGTALTAEHVTTWNFADNEHLAPYAAFCWDELYPDDAWHLTVPPVAGAVEALTHLQYAHLPVLVTARHGDRADITTQWLVQHGFPTVSIIHTTNKAAVCTMLRASVLIEDAPHNALAVADAGVPVLLFDRAYNRHVSHRLVTRVSGWAEALQVLES